MGSQILFKDDFEDESWSVVSGSWNIVLEDSRTYHTLLQDSLSRAVVGQIDWKNYAIEADVNLKGWGSEKFQTVGMIARYSDPENYYIGVFESEGISKGESKGVICIKRKLKGVLEILSSKTYTLKWGVKYKIKMTTIGDKITFSINGTDEISIADNLSVKGKAGLITCFADAYFDNFMISTTEITMKPYGNNTGPTNVAKLVKSPSIKVVADNSIIENVDVTGTISIKANNVTIRNFKVTVGFGEFYGIKINDGCQNIVIEDGEINGNAFASAGILGSNFIAQRLNIHSSAGDGVKAVTNATLQNCWIHDLGLKIGAHADGIQISAGSNIKIIGNNFDMPVDDGGTLSNAAVFIKPDFGNIDGVEVSGNWLNGGNYTIYVLDLKKDNIVIFKTTNVVISNNKFGRKYKYGVRSITTDAIWKDNVWEDNGTVVP